MYTCIRYPDECVCVCVRELLPLSLLCTCASAQEGSGNTFGRGAPLTSGKTNKSRPREEEEYRAHVPFGIIPTTFASGVISALFSSVFIVSFSLVRLMLSLLSCRNILLDFEFSSAAIYIRTKGPQLLSDAVLIYTARAL